MPTYTDIQLKRALVKLSNRVHWHATYDCLCYLPYPDNPDFCNIEVKDSELLQLCCEVEEGLVGEIHFKYWSFELPKIVGFGGLVQHTNHKLGHATWQQRTIALAKVKGVEII